MSSNGSVDRLLKRLLLPLSLQKSRSLSTLCHSCSRSQQLKQQHRINYHGRHDPAAVSSTPTAFRSVYSVSHPVASFGHRISLIFSRAYSSSLPDLPGTFPSTSTTDDIAHDSKPTTTSAPDINESPKRQHSNQRDASTSIAMIHYAKQGDPDQCLRQYLHLLQSQGTLPSHDALHQLARVLYIKRHVTGFSILHDTLLAYYTLNPLSGRQARNLTYIYTMFINLIIRQRQSKPTPARSSPEEPQQQQTDRSSISQKTATVIQLCQEMRQLSLPGSPVLYNSLLKYCVTKNDAESAWSLHNELVLRCTPTKHTYSILLGLARQQKDNERVLQILDSMAQVGVVPDRVMVSTVILILCDQRQYSAAMNLLDQLACHAPQIMGPQYRSVLMETMRRHSRDQYTAQASKQLRQYKRKHKRQYKRQQIGQLRQHQSS
ncbi:hypothetical protein [Absidia glauca]|uniref:Pentacotripeptide-repeat region of PRORP domain-containing protein n=1 Tax=Absidia glauca TaxID=4829 RepID=A0A163K3V4_ABSGL|nr:hypothetical protein [Absidia glauca]